MMKTTIIMNHSRFKSNYSRSTVRMSKVADRHRQFILNDIGDFGLRSILFAVDIVKWLRF